MLPTMLICFFGVEWHQWSCGFESFGVGEQKTGCSPWKELISFFQTVQVSCVCKVNRSIKILSHFLLLQWLWPYPGALGFLLCKITSVFLGRSMDPLLAA